MQQIYGEAVILVPSTIYGKITVRALKKQIVSKPHENDKKN